jgi:hypothetical protein
MDKPSPVAAGCGFMTAGMIGVGCLLILLSCFLLSMFGVFAAAVGGGSASRPAPIVQPK